MPEENFSDSDPAFQPVKAPSRKRGTAASGASATKTKTKHLLMPGITSHHPRPLPLLPRSTQETTYLRTRSTLQIRTNPARTRAPSAPPCNSTEEAASSRPSCSPQRTFCHPSSRVAADRLCIRPNRLWGELYRARYRPTRRRSEIPGCMIGRVHGGRVSRCHDRV
jgi:hypothetical protein